MSSLSDRMGRIGPALLFIALMAASTLAYRGMTPLTGSPATPAAVSGAVDRAATILSRAKRPFEDVVFSESLKAFVPDRVPLAQGPVLIADARSRPVLIAQRHAWDYPSMVLRAQRDGLGWTTGIGGAEVVAFAADEAGFRNAMTKAGLALSPADLHSISALVATSSPLLAGLQSQMKGVRQDSEGWSIPAHSDDGLMLYGPYVDLSAGPYRATVHAQLQGSAAQCRAAAARFHPTLAVTGGAGASVLNAATPAAMSRAPDDPCELTLETVFVVPQGGARRVETPLAGAAPLPLRVDGYALTVEPTAQSR